MPASQSRSTALSGSESYDENCSISGSYQADYSRSSLGCSYTDPDSGITNERDPYNFSLSCDYTPEEIPNIGDITASSTCGSLPSGPGSWAAVSSTQKQLPSPEDSGDFSYSGSHLLTLSAPDTEADALARATETEGTSCTSNYQERETGFTFNKTTVKFEAIVTGLIPGFCYSGIIPIEVRDDVEGGTYDEDSWTVHANTPIAAFEATQPFQTFGGGTLHVPDADFIAAGYSLNPLDYPDTFPQDGEGGLLDPDAKVITPFTDLPNTLGKAYRALAPILKRVDC